MAFARGARMGVRDHRHAIGLEDRVEGAAELGVPIVEQEAEDDVAVGRLMRRR
jgi:hypothetical protein